MTSLPAPKSGSGSVSGANGNKHCLVNNTSNSNDHGLQPPRGLGLSEPPISPAVTTGTASSGNLTDIHMRQLIRPKKFRVLSNASSILSDIFNHPDAHEDELKTKIKDANDRDREALFRMNESLRSTPPPPPPPPAPVFTHKGQGNAEEDKKHRNGLWGLFSRKSFKSAKKRLKSAPPKIVVPEPPAAGRATTTTHITEDGHRQTVISIPVQRTFNLGPVPRSPGFGLSPKSPITGTPIRPPRPSIGLETLVEQQESNERQIPVPANAPVIPPINDGSGISPLLPTEGFDRLQRVSGFIARPVESLPEFPHTQKALVDVDDAPDRSSSPKATSCQDHTLPKFFSPTSSFHLSVCLSTAQSSLDRRSKMSFGFKLPDPTGHTEEPLDGGVGGGETVAEVSEPSSSNTCHYRPETATGRDSVGSADVSSFSWVATPPDKRTALPDHKLRQQPSRWSNKSFTKGKARKRIDSLGGESVKTNDNQSTAFHTPPDLPAEYSTEPDAEALSSALEKVEALQLPPLRFSTVMIVADLKPLSCRSSINLQPSQSEGTHRQDGEPEQASGIVLTDSLQAPSSVVDSKTLQATPLSAPSTNLTKPLQLRRTSRIICPPVRLSSSSSSNNRSSRTGVPCSGSHIDLLRQCEEFRHIKKKELDILRNRLRQLENRNSWLLTAVTKQLPGGYEYQVDDYDDMEERSRHHQHNIITTSRASASNRGSMTSQHTFGNTTIDDSVTGTTGFSSSNLATGSRLTPPAQHLQHPRYNLSPATINNSSGSGSSTSSTSTSTSTSTGTGTGTSLSVRPTPSPIPSPILHSKPTIVTRSNNTCSTTASGGVRSFPLVTSHKDTSTTRSTYTAISQPIQPPPAPLPAARRAQSLPRDPRLGSFSSRSRSVDNKHDYKHNRTNSHDRPSGPANSCSKSNGIDGDKKSTNGVHNGSGSGSESGSSSASGSRSRSTSRGPAPFPPSLTYNGLLPDAAARRREKREYRRKQEEIMRRLADTPPRGAQQTNPLHSSSSSSSLGAVRQQEGKPSVASTSTSARSTALYNGSSSGSNYDSDQGFGGHNANNGHHVHDSRNPLTRLRNLRENVGRAICGIGIGLAVTSDEDGCIYDGYGASYQYHEDNALGHDSHGSRYGACGHDSYGGHDGDGYGASSGDLGLETGRGEGENREGQQEGEAQDKREAEAEGEYTLSGSSSLSRHHHHQHHHRNQDQRNDSPPLFSMPSWPSLPSLPSLPSFSGPSRSSLETEEWFPSLYRAHTQQTENQAEDTSSDYEPANSDNNITSKKISKRTIRERATSAALNGTEYSTSTNGNGNRNGWDTLEPLMRELNGKGGGNEPNGANGTAVSTSGIDDQQRINRTGHEETRPLVDNNKVFGLGPMDEKGLEEEAETLSRIRENRASLCAELRALEASINLLQ